MISKSSVRYEKLSTSDNCAELDNNHENCDEDEEVTVFLSQNQWRDKVRQPRAGTWVRLSVALLLLTLALGFGICEWHGCLSEEDNSWRSAATPGHSETGSKQKGHSHHHDDDHQEGDDHDPHENSDHDEPEHPNGLYHHGVVITDSAICSGIGRRILEEGGNAVDAGLASLLCLGVVHPHATGVGGVFSAILYNSTSGTHKAMRSISPGTPGTTYGTPATLQGIQQLHSRFGCCKWEKLFSAAATLAKDGFHIDQTLAAALTSNREKILQSNLCDLFCDGNDTVKVLGSMVANQKLAELLQFVSLNCSHFPESLALKLAEDLPLTERQGFAENVRRCGAEIGDPLIVEEDEYSIYAATSPLSSRIISDILGKAREQNLFPWNNADLNSSASIYSNLLTTANLIYKENLAKENRSVDDLLPLNPMGSHVGVLDGNGNVLLISSSLNSPFGSKRLLPATGVILSDVDLHPSNNVLQWICPLIVKRKHGHSHHDHDHDHDHDHGDDDDEDEDEDEVLAVGVTGGLSAPFVAAQIILSRVLGGKSAPDAVTGPLLHLETGSSGSLSGCISEVTNHSDVYQLLLERDRQLEGVASCADSTMALVLQTHFGHVGAYGAPAAGAHADGY